MNIKQLHETAQGLFTKRTQFMTLLQEVAENFYPMRADFTVRREVGDEFADNLMTSYPVIAHRELSDQLSTMLRPTQKEWFHIGAVDDKRIDVEGKRWLEWAADVMRRAMYDPKTKFTRATKEADKDFAAFGQAVMSVTLNRDRTNLLYRTWHIRDVAWKENEEGDIHFIVRRWKPQLNDLINTFKNVHANVRIAAEKKPFDTTECYHIVCEAQMYEAPAMGKKYFSIYYDCANEHVMEEIAVHNPEYIIPRWQTVAGSQYAYSPVTITALPEARLIQAMTYTLLQAGEKAVDPPMIATQDAIRSDISIYAGGVTWADLEYDERLGEALRPLTQDLRGIPFGFEMQQDTRALIHQAFYLNKLTLPERAPEMTAYEVGQRIQEYVRGAIPIFEPMEMEYNGALCEHTFDILLRHGAFGSIYDMPRSLSGLSTQFRFESPLHDAIEQQKGQTWLEGRAILADAAAIDQSALSMVDVKVALRDVLQGVGVPAEWMRSKEDVEQIAKAEQAAMESQAMMAAMEQGSAAAANLGKASKDMAEAQA